jgi:mannose-6-phosphate isomerase
MQIAIMELKCTIQQYAWGKHGQNSEVALLNRGGDPDFMIYNAMPYAELWMGTHPNGPSILKGSSKKLGAWIKAHPASLGAKVTEKFGVQLPFLFKVLSINEALSIQAHPDKVFHQTTKLKHFVLIVKTTFNLSCTAFMPLMR